MGKEKNKNKDKKEGKVEESKAGYYNNKVKRKITVSSLDEMDELDRRHTARLTPKKRLEYLQKLIKNLYGFNFTKQEKKLRKGQITIKENS